MAAISFGRARLDSFSRGTIRQMYVAEGAGGSRVRPIRPWPNPKPLKGADMSFGPTQNVMNVIMNGRVIKKFRAVLAVLRFQKVKFRACSAEISLPASGELIIALG